MNGVIEALHIYDEHRPRPYSEPAAWIRFAYWATIHPNANTPIAAAV